MIFILNREGTVTETVTSPVYQGSHTNEVVVLAPFAPTNTVTVGFTLPNGLTVQPQLTASGKGTTMTSLPVEDLSLKVGETYEDMSAWYCKLNRDITRYSGTLTMQFFIYDAAGDILASSSTTVPVQKGVPVLDGTTFDASTAAQLQTALNGVYATISSLNDGLRTVKETTEQNGEMISTLQNDVSQNATAISNIEAQVKEADASITSLESRISANEQNIDGLLGTTSELSQAVSGLNGDTKQLKSEIDALDARMYDVEDTVVSIEDRVTGDENSITGLEARMDNAEGNIHDLKSSVSFIWTILENTIITITTVEDTYTSRETAGGLPVVDSAPTTVHSIAGATRASDNLFSLAERAVTAETYGITVTADNNRLTFTGTPTRTSFGLVSDIDLGAYVGKTLTFSQTPAFSAWNVSGAIFWQIYRDGAVLGHAANANGSITVEIEEGHTYRARVQFGGSTDPVNETIAFMVNEGSTALPYSDYYPGLKTGAFGGIVSTGADVSDATFALATPVTLGKWDYIDVDAQKLLTGTATLTQETPFTDEQLAQYTDYVLSADRKTLAYRNAATTETALTIPKTYKAWRGGTETVTGNPSGLALTVKQDYYEEVSNI